MEKPPKVDLKNIYYHIKRLMILVISHSRVAYIKILLGALIGSVGLLISWLSGRLLDIAIDGNLQLLIQFTIILVAVSVSEAFAEYFNALLAGKYKILCGRTLRENVCSKVNNLSIAYYENNHTGGTVSTLINDIDQLENFYLTFIDRLCSFLPTSIIGGIILLAFLNLQLMVISFVIIPLLGFIVGRISMKLSSITNKIQNETEKYNTYLGDFIRGIHIYKSYDMKETFDSKFITSCDDVAKHNFKRFRLKDIANSIEEIANVVPSILVYIIGGLFTLQGELTIGELFIFVSVLYPVVDNITSLSQTWSSINEAVGHAKHFFTLLDATEERRTGSSPSLHEQDIMIEFRNVSFSYEKNTPVLQNISFTVKKGERVALVGASGCGKSTIHKLIAGHYDTYQGEIFIGSLSLKEWDLQVLRQQLSSITQEVYLFSDTIKNNIILGKMGADDLSIIDAATKANALEFINENEEKFDMQIGENGSKLSGGQRQRMAIARTILKDSPILLLDEPTSALDTKAEYLVQKAIENMSEDKTEIIIAHRLSTISNANRILVIEKGQIVESGNHDELLAKCGVYSKLYTRELVLESEREE